MSKVFRILLLLFCAAQAFAVTKIDITQGNVSPLPIAIAEFSGNRSVGNELRNIIINALEGTGLFRVIDKAAYIDSVSFNQKPTFLSWRQINATSLVGGKIEGIHNHAVVHTKMWDVFSETEVFQDKINLGSQENIRKVAHKIADEIYKKLTGEEGYFNTKVSYVSIITDSKGRAKRRLAVMDYDGYNHDYLTSSSNNIVVTPRFSPSGNDILYLSYEEKLNPKVRSINVRSKFSHPLGQFKGMSYAPRYVDSKTVLLAVAKNGVSNIHLLDLETHEQTQLTSCSSICTSPSSSPDKKKIVFNSDMGGTRQLYVMDYDGRNQERISFNHGYYSSPLWSPRGDLIAFTKMLPGKGFFIGVMRPDGSGERVITRGWLVDGASWAPNGRVLMFEKESGPGQGKKIYSIDITGNNERILLTPHQASDPSWSNNFDPE